MQFVFLTAQLSSAAGGMSASVPSLAHALGTEMEVHVVGGRDPMRPDEAVRWGPEVHALPRTGPRALHYTPDLTALLTRLAPDVTDVQGLWTYPSLANLRHHRRTGMPYVVTPRGMLDPWALRNSAWKKRLARAAFEGSHLHGAACLRATAEMEAEHFRAAGFTNPIAIVPNGVDVPPLAPRVPTERSQLLFLSRIHPKKGLPLLLRSWGELQARHPDWDLVIAGPDEGNHEADMKGLARQLGLNRVNFIGEVQGERKTTLYRNADLFVLPTHAENFGLVVAEALAQEVPVITTRNAPWAGLETQACGWWINLSQNALTQALGQAMALPGSERQAMGARGRAWMARDFGWQDVAQRMLAVYSWIAGRGAQPDCVVR